MFYTQYRPQKFGELVGANSIVSAITGAISKGSPSHAYFFTGSRGVGKTTIARLIAKSLNCESPITGAELKKIKALDHVLFEPCGKCRNCRSIEGGNHLDLIEIDAASNRGIDNIRDLRDKVKLSPSMGKNKIYIIDEVHMLTTEASNALLKTLEEPPSHVYFILCTTNPEKVLDTIKSRCVQVHLSRPGVGDIVTKLRQIAKDQKFDISDEKLKRIAIVAKGAYREAETIFEQVVNGEGEIDALLNEQESNYFEFTSLIISGNKMDSIKFVHEVYSSGISLDLWTERFIEYLRSLLLEKVEVTGVDNTFELNDLEKSLVASVSLEKLKNMAKIFNKALSEFKFAVVPTLPLEIAIIESSEADTEEPFEAENGKSPLEGSGKNFSRKPHARQVKKEVKGSKSSVSVKSSGSSEAVLKRKVLRFPYVKLIELVKPQNHSIHVMLRSCDVISFDGSHLKLKAYYSFHKERLMGTKVRNIIEEAASNIVKNKVIVSCELSSEKPKSKRLTDRNITLGGASKEDDVIEVLEKIFGDELEG